MGLELVLDEVIRRPTQSPDRLRALADYIIKRLDEHGLAGVRGGSGGELKVVGLARSKDWDIAYDFAGKFRLLISLKSMWRNAEGTVPNRLDDLMGEVANVQQIRPEIVIGYVLLFDIQADKRRKDGLTWSEFFERAIQRIAIRRAPLWNQGLLEGCWFLRFDSLLESGSRLVDPAKTARQERAFFKSLLAELKLREPAIPFDNARLERLIDDRKDDLLAGTE